MKANPDKFQAICFGKKANDSLTSFNIASTEINCEENVTLLGVNIDYSLKFLTFEKKPSRQLVVFKK